MFFLVRIDGDGKFPYVGGKCWFLIALAGEVVLHVLNRSGLGTESVSGHFLRMYRLF